MVLPYRAMLLEKSRGWGLIGIILLVLGMSIALIGYVTDSTYCKSLGKMIEGFYTTKAA